jgi:putative transposase
MARKQRIHIPGSTYHCMLRGNDGNNIFQQEKDFSRLSLLLQEGTEKYDHRILGFCFMTNHIHLVIQVANIPLSKIVQNFAFRYARYINKNYKKIGHLFQGRFQAVLVSDSEYLLELIRYVHLNPVRARMVKTPDEYFWNGHHTYLDKQCFQWISPLRVLKYFDNNKIAATKKYSEYIYKGIGKEVSINFESGNQKGLDVLGDDTFTEKLIFKHALSQPRKQSTDELLQISLRYFKISLADLASKSKNHKNSRIRSIISLLTRESEGCSLTKLAKSFNRDISSLSLSANRIENTIKQSDKLSIIVQELRELTLQIPKCKA